MSLVIIILRGEAGRGVRQAPDPLRIAPQTTSNHAESTAAVYGTLHTFLPPLCDKTITYPLVKGVCLENREKWMELCEQASTEQDPEKLLALVQEINRLLEAKQERLNKQKTPKD